MLFGAKARDRSYGRLLFLREVEHADSTQFQAGTMAEEADVARLVEHARVIVVVNRVRIVVASVGSNVVTLAGFLDVAIDDDFAINRYGLHREAPLAHLFRK